MRKLYIGILASLFLLSGCTGDTTTPAPDAATPTATSGAAAPGVAPLTSRSSSVVVTGKVQPVTTVGVNFAIDGIITEVLVEEGATVKKGDPLARLDAQDLALRVEQAQAILDQTRIEFEVLQDGPPPEEIEQLRARVAAARARVKQIESNFTAEDIQAAREALQAKQISLIELEAGPKSEDIRAAQAALDESLAMLQATRDSRSAEKTIAISRVEKAANNLRDVQATYSRIYWRNRGSGESLSQAEIDEEEQALRAVRNAEEDLAQAQVVKEEAIRAEASEVAAAEARARNAQARLEQVLESVGADQIAGARAQVSKAVAELERIAGTSRTASLEGAQAELADAEAGLKALLAQPRSSNLAMAQARLRQLEANLKQAHLALERATLRAPIDGVVAEVGLRPGDNTERSYIIIADFSSWEIVINDVTEIDIVRVREGDPVKITFYALPELELPGEVKRIGAIGKDGKEISYTLIIAPTRWDERLRWNMTASVSINISR